MGMKRLNNLSVQKQMKRQFYTNLTKDWTVNSISMR